MDVWCPEEHECCTRPLAHLARAKFLGAIFIDRHRNVPIEVDQLEPGVSSKELDHEIDVATPINIVIVHRNHYLATGFREQNIPRLACGEVLNRFTLGSFHGELLR